MKSYDKLFEIIKQLRAPDGCPWDIEQTPETMSPSLIEESYELIEAIEHKDYQHVAEEIGDLILVATMIGYMNQQQNNFTLDDVFNSISEKLIRRHPHVFSDVKVKDSDEVLKNWDKIKSDVEGRKKKSALESIPKSLPPLERAFKIQKKVAKQGFDWDDIESTFDKLHEEIGELKNELVKNRQDNKRISEECGDLLFSSINICRKLNCDPSIALDKTNRKFSTRYNYVENSMKNNNIEMIKENFDKMNLFWEKSKEFEN